MTIPPDSALKRLHPKFCIPISLFQKLATLTVLKIHQAFQEALKIRSTFDCFIFHDVDLLPENDYNIYRSIGSLTFAPLTWLGNHEYLQIT